MRLLLGLILLLGAFALVLVWRERSIAAAVATRATATVLEPATPGWAEVRIGRFSGAAPLATGPERALAVIPASVAPARPSVAASEPTSGNSTAAAPAKPKEPREFELTVQRGQTLSEICRAHYNTARVKLVDALARHNGLREAGALREGAKLRLPPIETLEAR
jgi:hypothetical protein